MQERPGRPPESREALRRRATIVFCDLAGYTALNEALDPEEVEAIMARIKADAIRIVEGLGGVVNQFVGDEVMALFGVPVAHGDDAARAVLAALALHEAIGPLAADVHDRTGMRIAFHTAVNTGLVVARRRDDREGRFTVTGDAVNTCARLLKLAQADEIVVGAPTQRLVADRFVTEGLTPAQVKGKALPLTPYRVVRERPAAERARVPHFVGRTRELAVLDDVLRRARAGAGGSVHVRGEPGMGKSSLVREAVRLAEEAGHAVHLSLALDFGVARGRDAAAMLAASLLDTETTRAAEERAGAVDAAVQSGLVTREQRMFVEDLLALPQAPEDRALFEAMADATRTRHKQLAVVDVVRGAAAAGPLLVVVEDLQWADLVMRGMGAELAALAGGAPLAVVTTSRRDGDPTPGDRGDVAALGLTTLSLSPLGADEARALAERLEVASAEVVARCVERAGGNPLFLVQLLADADVDDGSVPTSVESTVLARLDRVPAAAREALQAASVLGRHFDAPALESLLSPAPLDGEALVRTELVRPDGENFAFAHALVRDAIYAALLLARRKELHGRAAAWYAARDLALRAEHLERAGDPGAASAFLEAARSRLAALDLRDALRIASRGAQLPAAPAVRHELLMLAGRIHLDLGDGRAALEAHRAALDLAEQDDQRCRAWLGVAGGLRLADEYAEALAAVDRAAALAVEPPLEPKRGPGSRPLEPELARIHHLRGNLLFPLGDMSGCMREHAAALDYARRIGSSELEAVSEGGVGDANYLRGDMAGALRCFARCVELARAHGLVRVEVANAPMLGWMHAYAGEPRRALAAARPPAELARRVGVKRAELVAFTVVGWAAIEVGDLEVARAGLVRHHDLAASLASPRFAVQALVWSAHLARAEGDRDAAADFVERAERSRRPADRSFNGAFTLGAVARMARDPAARAAALERGEALLAEGAAIHNHLWFYRDAIEVALEWHQWDRAARYAEALEACTLSPLVWSGIVADRARALAAGGQGRRDAETLAALRSARDRAVACGYASLAPALDRALA